MTTRGDTAGNKHGAASDLADAAFRAERDGDPDRAEALMEQAGKTDPDAVVDALAERPDVDAPAGALEDAPSLSSELVVPGSDAPSRAGITGTGSGADNQGL